MTGGLQGVGEGVQEELQGKPRETMESASFTRTSTELM